TVTGAAEAVSGRVDDLENAVDNRVSYTNGTAVGSASVPVYVTKDGVATKVTSVAASLLPAATSSTKGAVITGTNITNDSGTISVATGTPSTLGVVKVGQIPSGSATSTTYATIWVE
ncbi:MAG: hypothetical protein IJX89_03350, partial [Alphaproteobacteria bacterium]|nr:hypothetical protein [Alphaproteobacteria bacterium]